MCPISRVIEAREKRTLSQQPMRAHTSGSHDLEVEFSDGAPPAATDQAIPQGMFLTLDGEHLVIVWADTSANQGFATSFHDRRLARRDRVLTRIFRGVTR